MQPESTPSPKRRVAVALRINQPYPNHQDVLSGVRRYAREHPHWKCMIDEHPDRREPDGDEETYDGVISRCHKIQQRRLRTLKIPFVNTMYLTASPSIAGVYVDVAACARVAADHLFERGFRRFAFLEEGSYRQAKDIGEVFRQLISERGYECAYLSIKSGNYPELRRWLSLKREITAFLKAMTPPIAFLVSVPWLARLLTTLCEDCDLHVPQQVAVVCVDNHKNVVEMHPQITCIDCNYEQVGYEAAALLERIMSGNAAPNTQLYVQPRGIITRESTDHFAVEDELVGEAIRFISRNLAGKLSLDQIADAVMSSPRSLQRRFDAAMGRSVSDEIRRLRIELAKRLLAEKDLQIRKVAQLSGFGNSVILSQVFRREVGVTPSDYRKRNARA